MLFSRFVSAFVFARRLSSRTTTNGEEKKTTFLCTKRVPSLSSSRMVTLSFPEDVVFVFPTKDVFFFSKTSLEEKNTEDDDDDDKAKKEEKVYVWKRGIALEEKTVVRENQAKIDALYPKKEGKESSSSSSLYHRRRRVDARDILRTYAKTREEEDALKQTSIASQLLLFATVFAYAVGFAVTTHRGVVDLSTPAPIECEKSDAECTEETLPKRVEVFVSL